MESFLGSHITLTSKSDIRYRGILQNIDQENKQIILLKVTSLGTENRRPPHLTIPPSDAVYEQVVFKATDVKDLEVERHVPPPVEASFPNDPAIMSYNTAPAAPAQPKVLAQPTAQANLPARPTQAQPPQVPLSRESSRSSQPGPSNSSSASTSSAQLPQQQQQRGNRPPGARDFETTINRVGQALGETRGANQARNLSSTAQGLPGALSAKAPPVPKEAFDFEEMNKRFEKLKKDVGVAKPVAKAGKGAMVDEDEDEETSSEEESDSEDEVEEEQPAYNKSKSFFDSVSSDVQLASQHQGGRGGYGGGRGRGGGGGGGGYRWRREDEAAANLSTFGEVGGNGNDFGRGRGRGGMGFGFGGGRGRGGQGQGQGQGYGGGGGGRGGYRGDYGNGRPGQ